MKHEVTCKTFILAGQTPPDDIEEIATISFEVRKVSATGERDETPVATADFPVSLSAEGFAYWVRAHDGSWWQIPMLPILEVAAFEIAKAIDKTRKEG